MTSEVVDGDRCSLVPLPPDASLDAVSGGYAGHPPGRGWPHEDTGDALGFAAAGALTWLVLDETGSVVGELGTKGPPDHAGTVEIGYGLAGPARGRGLGGRAVAALLGRLAEQPGVRRVTAHVEVTNVASRRLLERLGFAGVAVTDAGEVRYERELDR
jgi:RimJ/RimL family protein N-acetyltransferase